MASRLFQVSSRALSMGPFIWKADAGISVGGSSRFIATLQSALQSRHTAQNRDYKILEQKRYLNLHEYQSLDLMAQYGVAVPRGAAGSTVEEIEKIAHTLAGDKACGGVDYVVKAQVLAGGRGLGHFKENSFKGGVHLCTSVDQLKEFSGKMLNNTLITKQTGEAGKICRKVYVCERFYIRKERYMAILMDRKSGGPLLIGSSVGGTSIEEIAETHPDSIVKMPIDIMTGLSKEQAFKFCQKLCISPKNMDEAVKNVLAIYKLFIDKDCSLIEVNPFAETHDGKLMVCDAKVNFDDNASFRQQAIFSMADESQIDPREVQANKFDLNYVGLDGNIGCMVNGAGLAMATMDIIKLYGGSPANFLDVGWGANKAQVVEALRILQEDTQVKAIMVNIFGGIMRCDTIGLGIISATQEVGLTKPLVVRLQGTKQVEAKALLDSSGLRMMFCSDLEDAAQKVVKMVQIIHLAEGAKLDVSFAM